MPDKEKPKSTAKPAAAKPTAAKPATAKPAAKPTTAKPAAPKAAAAKPVASKAAPKPATEKPATTKSATAKPAANTPAAPKAAATKTTTEKPVAEKQIKEQPVAAATVSAPKRADKKLKAKPESSSESKGGILVLSKKTRYIIMAAVAFVLVIALVVGITVGAVSCNRAPDFSTVPPVTDRVKDDNPFTNTERTVITTPNAVKGDVFEYGYSAMTEVGFSATVEGEVERKKSVATYPDGTLRTDEGATFGNDEYPKYGYTLNSVIGASAEMTQARQDLIEESDYYCALGTRNNSGNGNNGDATFTWMDANGYLYSGTTANPVHAVNADGTNRQLYKHSAAAGMYYGGYKDTDDLLDSEPGIVKKITLRPRGYSSYSVTGVYAPAGEIIKITISEADMNATGGLTIHIGQALYNGQSNNIWAAKGQMQRFPNVLNTMNVNKDTATLENGYYTAYVGSFLGGPLYIRNTSAAFTATISGGVAYSHFILGYTTEEEFEKNRQSSAPYFDLEVWSYGVLHSGTKYQAQNYSYDDLYKAAVLWEKVASVTTTGSNQGIVFLYEPFVAAGAAVAFPGRSSVNCPTGWMTNSLNYNTMVSSGAWGNFHEYHHNFQGYGVGNGGEVTNNGMTLVSYALFTKISSKRGISSYGGQGLGGWNNYTSATWALNDLLSIRNGGSPSNGKQGLALYATLLHNFGANNYIQAKVKGGGQSYQAYANAWEAVTHNNMSYYFNEVLKGGIKSTAPDEYPMFVPVSSVYQTGRSYMYDGEKRYFNTMQPYVIPYGEEFNVDLSQYNAPNGQYASGSIVIPDNFEYKVKSISQPKNGTIEVVDGYNFKFKPNSEKLSGQIIVTLEIKEKSNKFKVDDVDLVLEFEQSHETNKMTLERTTYTYTAETMYKDAKTAYESSFAGYGKVVEKANHINPTQNCNTDIWFYPNTDENHNKYPNAPESYFFHSNTVEVIDGKLYFEEAGKYRIYLRGRSNCAVYYSTDGKNYKYGAAITEETKGVGHANFFTNDPTTYFDVDLEEHSWVHVREVLIVQETARSYIGLGYAQWIKPMFTITEDENGNKHYFDQTGKEVSEEEANNAQLTEPKKASYINAYRSNYEFPDNKSFESDYFFTRQYKYNYSDNVSYSGDGQTPVPELTKNLTSSWGGSKDITILTDGIKNQGNDKQIHTAGSPTEAKPFEFGFDLGSVKPVNRVILYSQPGRADPCFAKNLDLYGSQDGTNFELIKSFSAPAYNNGAGTQIFDFDTTELRYYKISINGSTGGQLILREVEIWNIFEVNGGTKFSPDDKAFTYGGKWRTESTLSSYGHVFVGEKNAQMAFIFNGTRLAILSSEAFGKKFTVEIDGVEIDSIALKAISGGFGATFISPELEDKKHTVLIKCKGQANIDSIVVF